MIPSTIIISRTDSIGDVILTLPMCGIIKKNFPNVKIIFLAKAYTEAIVKASSHVDEFVNWDEMNQGSPASQITALQKMKPDVIIHVFPRKEILWLAKRAHISWRIATAGRIYTIGKCNKLVFFSRKKSTLHEAQLNLKLLKPLGIDADVSLEVLPDYYGFNRSNDDALRVSEKFLSELPDERKKIILHPLSKGSASDWSLANYNELSGKLIESGFEVIITGTKEEGEKLRMVIDVNRKGIHDTTGRFSLQELLELIRRSDALVAASTGPLHIAAASGILAVGLYSPKRPIHPGRWAPLGINTKLLVAEKHPMKGQKLDIKPDEVLKVLLHALR